MRIALLALACTGIASASNAAGMAQSEIQVKAAFLYNFARFTEWPEELKGPLLFCVLGEDRLDRELEPLVRAKTIADRKLAVRYLSTPRQAGDCNVIYIGKSERNRIPGIVQSAQGRSVLVVSEYPELGKDGATLNFFVENERMRFAVNLAAAGHAGITLSSHLLKLARVTNDKR